MCNTLVQYLKYNVFMLNFFSLFPNKVAGRVRKTKLKDRYVSHEFNDKFSCT